jgi:thymidylate synthase
MVNAWNVGELDQMVLPPCHYGFQVYTRELSLEERRQMYKGNLLDEYGETKSHDELSIIDLDKLSIPKRAISLMWNQRSVDTFLGLPFNIASYGLLLEIIAKEVNMVPDELIGNLGDTHLYLNHIEQAKEQIGRKYTPEERETMLKDAMSLRLYNKAVNELMPFGGGMSEYYEMHKILYRTREPFPLPKLVFLDEYHYMNDIELVGEIPFTEKINQFRPDLFKIENYQSHPSIKGELSN